MMMMMIMSAWLASTFSGSLVCFTMFIFHLDLGGSGSNVAQMFLPVCSSCHRVLDFLSVLFAQSVPGVLSGVADPCLSASVLSVRSAFSAGTSPASY